MFLQRWETHLWLVAALRASWRSSGALQKDFLLRAVLSAWQVESCITESMQGKGGAEGKGLYFLLRDAARTSPARLSTSPLRNNKDTEK